MKGKYKNVYLLEGDGVGWAPYKNKYYHLKALKDLGISIVNDITNADIIYSTSWKTRGFLGLKFKLFKKLFKKTVIITITNEISHHKDHFMKIKGVIDKWVYYNSRQKRFLLDNGIRENNTFWNPPCFDEAVFKRLSYSKKEIVEFFDIEYNKIKDRFLIGSFQRDSQGKNLSKPKWQKNPDLLIKIFKDLDKERFVLVLAGPRRHYIIKRCKEFDIPHIFVGNEDMVKENRDDMLINNLSTDKINLLYNLIDLYIVSSKSEGLPRAILETALTKTPTLSTDVGIAKDFLDEYSIYGTKDGFLKKIEDVVKNESQ